MTAAMFHPSGVGYALAHRCRDRLSWLDHADRVVRLRSAVTVELMPIERGTWPSRFHRFEHPFKWGMATHETFMVSRRLVVGILAMRHVLSLYA